MDFIHQMEPWFDENEITAMVEYLKSDPWLTEFKKTKELEGQICEFTGAKFCTMVNNGTVSLAVALMALGIGAGDDVIVPDFTMIASANAAILCGSNPVFVDIEESSLCLDIDSFKSAITKNTKALVLVSINGRYPTKLAEIIEVCMNENILILEDAAQSLGSFKGDKHLGTLGNIGSFSFSSQKIVTTGQGGALITDNEELSLKIRALKDFGRDRGGIDIHKTMGFNFKLTDLQAVIGIEQMKKLPFRIKRKKEIFHSYQQLLEQTDQVEFIHTNLEETTPWFIDILVPDPKSLQTYLRDNNIGTRVFYPPIHLQPAYNRNETYPVAEKIAEHGLWLPSSSQLKDSDIEFICSSINQFYS